jgi:hypothetical protein
MKVDLREPGKALKVNSKLDVQALTPVRAISFAISEGLPEDESLRKRQGMRATGARLLDGTVLQIIQEEWNWILITGCFRIQPLRGKKMEKSKTATDKSAPMCRSLSECPRFPPGR